MTASPMEEQQKLVFEQYKLAVEMAAAISARRQTVNAFYVTMVSGFGVLKSLIDTPSSTLISRGRILSILPICLCAVWWLTIYSYRRINKAKWEVIYEVEKGLPWAPFTLEKEELGSKSLMLTRVELTIPIVVGLAFLALTVGSFIR